MQPPASNSTTNDRSDGVVIIGGGLGGLALANTLQHFGIAFDLYEQAPELTEIGAGIGLTRNVQDIFQPLGLLDELKEAATAVRMLCIADAQLNVRRLLDIEYEALCIHRAALVEILRRHIPPERLHLSKRATDVRSESDRAVVSFADGTSVSSSCVVAADGISSTVRKQLFPEIAMRFTNQTIWRGVTRMEVPDLLKKSYIEIWAKRLRYLTVPYGDSMFWLAVQPAEPGGRDNPETIRQDLQNTFSEFHPLLLELIGRSESIIRNDMADLGTKKRSWHHNRVVFLGDAIHATTPNMAQGGCQAIEDAMCLALCLKNFGDDTGRAYSTYQRLRQPKVNYIIKNSWWLGKAAHSRNPFLLNGFRLILERSPDAFMLKQERLLNDLSYLREVDPDGLMGLSVARSA
ncbi:FAD-dependent monooxygenase [soil metagenome]